MSKIVAIVVAVFVIFVSVGYSLGATVNVYQDFANTIPIGVFGNGQNVYVTAYNGVSCCSPIVAQAYTENGMVNFTLSDNNDGLYRGSFVVGINDTNQTLKYLHLDVNETGIVSVVFTQLSNGTKKISADYNKPEVVSLNGHFDNGVFLNWTTSSDENGVDRYLIYRYETNVTENDLLYNSKETNFIDRNVLDGKRYYYSIRAVDSVGNKADFSDSVYVDTPDITAPNEINDLYAKGLSVGRIFLNWSMPYDNTRVSYYLLYRSTTNNFVNVSYYANISLEKFVDQNVSNDVKYYYYVIAIDENGNYAKASNIASAYTTSTAPKAIGNLKAELGNNGTVVLKWSTECNCSFRVYKTVFPINSSKDIEGLLYIETQSMNYSDKLENSMYYTIVAFDGLMNSAGISNVVKVEPDLIAPSAVKNLKIISDPNKKIIISWQPSTSSDLSYYALYKSTDGSLQLFTTTDKTEYIDYDVFNGQMYYYLVRSVDKFGNEDNNTNFVNATAIDAFVLLEINYPSNDSELSQDKVAVIGRTDPGSIVKIKNVVNGSTIETDAIVDKNGLFIGYASLGDGFNGIEIDAKDASGNEQKGYIILNNRLFQTSYTSLDNSLENLKIVVYNNTVNDTIVPGSGLITELARNDPNIVKEKINVENYITGNTVPVDFVSPTLILFVLLAALAIAGFFVYKRFLKDRGFLQKTAIK